jgi:TPR repeat protein
MMKTSLALVAALCASAAFAQSTDTLIKACDGGDVKACQQGAAAALAKLDAKTNFAFVDRGCALRDARACETLGEFYRHGIGTKQNYRRAMKYSLLACDAGVAEGCLRAGFLHNEGQSVPVNKARAQDFYDKACALGYEGPVC